MTMAEAAHACEIKRCQYSINNILFQFYVMMCELLKPMNSYAVE